MKVRSDLWATGAVPPEPGWSIPVDSGAIWPLMFLVFPASFVLLLAIGNPSLRRRWVLSTAGLTLLAGAALALVIAN
ncbi:MAG: hypothetical protein RIE08_00980 [Acidimicrobiales bacterium]